MHRSFASFTIAAAILVSLYACSVGGDDPGTDDGGPNGGGDGTTGDGATGDESTSGGDGATTGDGSKKDGAGGGDGSDDGAVDAPIDSADAAPATPAVQFIGRFDMAPVAGPKVSWPGARIIARFSGTDVSATFTDTPLYNPEWGTSRWEVIVDGVSQTVLQINTAQ